MKLIESESVERDYGFMGTEAIAEHPKHGRIFICDGFGGIDTLHGGAVRWRHGLMIKLKDKDTLESLNAEAFNDYNTVFQAMVVGYDNDRPIIGVYSSELEKIAQVLDLDNAQC